jgi:hypothetical protein
MNPSDRELYVLEKLDQAVHALKSGTGSVQERLEEASDSPRHGARSHAPSRIPRSGAHDGASSFRRLGRA